MNNELTALEIAENIRRAADFIAAHNITESLRVENNGIILVFASREIEFARKHNYLTWTKEQNESSREWLSYFGRGDGITLRLDFAERVQVIEPVFPTVAPQPLILDEEKAA